MTFLINPYTQENNDIVYDICVKTADNGDDASHLHEGPKLIGHCFAGFDRFTYYVWKKGCTYY